MGRLHKRFNQKGRQVVETVIDESEQNKIQIELPEDTSHYDASNALVLPSAKRKTKKLKDKNAAPVKLLSRKQRKKLLKIAEKKVKNAKREKLLEELQKVQANPKDMDSFTSLQTIQTLGRKKYMSKKFEAAFNASSEALLKPDEEIRKSNVKWKTSNSIKRELKLQKPEPKRQKRDYNVVQTDSSSCSSEDEEDNCLGNEVNDIKTTAIEKSKENNVKSTVNGIEISVSKDKVKEVDSESNEEENLEANMSVKKSKVKKKKKINNGVEMKFVSEIENKKSKKDGKLKKKKKKIILMDNEDEIKEAKNDKSKTERKSLKKKKKVTLVDNPDDNIKVTQSNKEKKIVNNINEKSKENKDESKETPEENSENNCNDDKTNPKNESQAKTHTFRIVKRDPEIQKHRLKLPILSEEHAIMEAINENPITIVVGPTGSGKTTQIPQFLYEAGYTSNGMKIGVTEPRRIAATSMAERVGLELNLPSSKVSYQIRYEGNVTPETEIKFMTDGVLFQEIKNNHFLKSYSAIIIDEVHERSVHSDILLGLLSRIVPQRSKKGNPLKLIIMSATPRIEDFTKNANLFKEGIPPVIQVPTRLYDVTIHFNKATNPDYCESAFKKVCTIHRQLPDGGILVFLTGQQEILELCKRLKETFPVKEQSGNSKKDFVNGKKKNRKSKKISVPDINLKDFVNKSPEKKSREIEENEEIPDEEIFSEEISRDFLVEDENPLWVLPLYSLLPSHKQKRVFDPPPEGTRLCVVSTNVAETSLTIPNIKYVVDSGKTKEKLYDPVTGISSFHISWTSKASATQRCGRAGRTSEGHCYRLYSSAAYNDQFPQYTIPDIQKRPLDDVVLAMKALNIPVYKFPFPSPPDPKYLSESFKRLTVLGALEESPRLLSLKNSRNKDMDITEITNLGRSMSCLAMAPRFAKIILNCHQRPEIYPYAVITIAALTVREIFIEIPLAGKNLHPIHQNWGEQRIKWSGKGRSHLLGDLLVLINAVLEAEKNNFSFQWCYENGLRHSALLEYRKLRRQLTNEINVLIEDANLLLQPGLKPPTDDQAYLLAEIFFMGSVDQVARKVDCLEFQTKEDRKKWRNAYRTVYSDQPVFLSSASALCKEKPQYIMYQEIYESTKVYLRCCTVINEAWLLFHGESLANMSAPLDIPPPTFDKGLDRVICHRSGTFGPQKWELRAYPVEFPQTQDLFKWVAYFFLTGELWPPLKPYVQYLYDPKTLTSPITLRYREKRENLIKAMIYENIKSGSDLRRIWKKNPNFLRNEYFSWFENEEKLSLLSLQWPLLEKEEYMLCDSSVRLP